MKIRVGVIGTGFMGLAHVDALRRLPSVEVIAVAASSEEKARAFAQRQQIPRAYGDPSAFIADADIDVVHNCTPNHLHFPINQAALQAGKHVLSEKPLAMNTTETAALVDLAERRGRVAAVNYAYRYYPLVQHARRFIQSGALGRMFLVHGFYLQDWLLYETDYNWRVDPARGGTSRAIADIGSHWCDLVQHVTGRRITHVCAEQATIHATRLKPKAEAVTFSSGDLREATEVPVGTEDYAGALIRLDDGARGFFAVSQVSAGHQNSLIFEIDCAEGAVRWDQEEPEHLWIGRRDRPSEILPKSPGLLDERARGYAHYPVGHPEGYPDVFTNLFRNVYAHVADRSTAPEFPTFHEAHQIAAVVEAMLASHQQGKWVAIPE